MSRALKKLEELNRGQIIQINEERTWGGNNKLHPYVVLGFLNDDILGYNGVILAITHSGIYKDRKERAKTQGLPYVTVDKEDCEGSGPITRKSIIECSEYSIVVHSLDDLKNDLKSGKLKIRAQSVNTTKFNEILEGVQESRGLTDRIKIACD